MKRLVLVATGIAFLAVGSLARLLVERETKVAPAAPDPLTDAHSARVVDFGQVVQGETIFRDLSVRNTSDAALTIDKISSSCGCVLVLEEKHRVVDPGAETLIRLRINTAVLSSGPVTKQVTVHRNHPDPELRELVYVIKGVVLVAFAAVPSQIQCGRMRQGARVARRLVIKGDDPAVLSSFDRVDVDGSNVLVKLTERATNLLTFEVIVTPEMPCGDFARTVTLHFKDKVHNELGVLVLGRVVADLAVIPRQVLIGTMHLNHEESRRIRLESTAGIPFKVTAVDSCNWVRPIVAGAAPGPPPSVTLDIHVRPDHVGELTGWTTIHTDSPSSPALQVLVKATVVK